MQNRIKRIFAMLLCLGMLIALLPTFAAAEDAEPDESAIELPEVEDAEPEEEPADELLLPEADKPKDSGSVTISDEPLVVGRNEYWFYTPGEIVYRPFTPEEDAFYQMDVRYHRVILADSELNEIARMEPPDTSCARTFRVVLHAGETYYFGFQYLDPTSTGYCITWFSMHSLDSCGNSMTWEFDEETGTLFFHGSGAMWSHAGPDEYPWAVYKDQVRKVDFTDVNHLEMVVPYAFYRYENLIETAFARAQTPKIGNYAFCGTGITSLHMSSGANYIGKYAFADCKNLTSFSMSIGIGYTATVSEYAFYNSGLRTMTLDKNSRYDIKPYAFANCYDLETLTGSEYYETTIGEHAFENSGICTITGLSKLTTIGAYAFANCENLTAVPGANGLQEISEYAFCNSGVQSLHIGTKLTTIGKGAFAGCTKLTTQGLTVDPENTVFTAKNGLLLSKDERTVQIALYQTASGAYTTPTGLQKVADGAFYGCAALSELTLSPGIDTVGAFAFTDCPTLTDVSIPLTLTEIKSGAFSDCGVTDVYYAGTEANRNAKLTIASEGNDALLNATWHYQEPCSFDGSVKWNTNDVQFKGTTPYMICTGNPLTPGFTLKTADGETVDPATYTVEYRENVNAGTAYIFVTFTEGYTGTMRLFFKIYLPATTEMSIWNIKDGIKLSWKPVPGADGYVIYRRAWNQQSAGWTTFERWNNTTGTTWTDKTVYAGTRYQYGVKAYFNRRMDRVTGAMLGGNVGDNYNLGMVGPLKTTVRITTRHLSMLKAGSSRITATWEPSKVFTGYELRYSTDETFTNDLKTVSITDPTTSSITLKSLKNGKYYYVSIRSYHEFEGMTYYGQWSNVIRIKPGSSTTVYDVMYRALTIGENTYKQSPLKGCVNDMKAMSGMLKKLNRPFTVKTLQNADKATIIKGISTAFAEAWDNDVSVFHYSGHGVDARGSSDYEQMQGALVSVDMQYITFKELAEELSKVKGRVIVILDSCHSGASIAKSDKENQEELEAFNQAAIDAFSGYYLETNGEEGGSNTRMGELKQSKFIVITAASSGQSSYDGKFDGSGYHQGAFTAAIIKGLGCKYPDGKYTGSMPADKNGDNKITLKELYDYAFLQANEWVYQNAQYYGPDGEVLFRR